MSLNPLSFFTDSILRAPTIGCMLMCFAASLMGVIVFLRRQSLIGEALSHAAYPGMIVGVILTGMFAINQNDEFWLSLLVLSGAFLTALLGIWSIHFLERRLRVPADAALCFILSAFFGIGLTLASQVQFTYSSLYKQALSFLYGQAATMTDIHLIIYGILAFIVLSMILLFNKELQVITFDRQYAKSLGISVKSIDSLLFILVTLAVIIGIRSVGVVLMSAMLIAPAVAARQLTHRLSTLFILSAIFGMSSGFFGNYFSVYLTEFFAVRYPDARIVLPTGPMIVLVATAICLGALLFAPDRGLLMRLLRMGLFRFNSISENILKTLWQHISKDGMSVNEIAEYQGISIFYLRMILWWMKRQGWIEQQGERLRLSSQGQIRASKIIHLHRLWEVYLANQHGEPVALNVEEMEQILTPELEKELMQFLSPNEKDSLSIHQEGGIDDG